MPMSPQTVQDANQTHPGVKNTGQPPLVVSQEEKELSDRRKNH